MQSIASRPIPRAKSLPYLGVALDLRVDPLRHFLNLYHELGPIFQITLLGRPIIVMAGLEANRFLARDGETYFTSEPLFGGLGQEMGSDAFLVALDGPAHRHQRKIQQRGFSRDTMQNNLGVVKQITYDFVQTWSVGQRLPFFPTLQRIVTDQLGMLTGGRVCGDLFDDLWALLNTNMNVQVLKTHPKFFLKLPKYVRSKQRVFVFAREVLEWHRANPPVDREPRLIDDLVAGVDENGRPYSDAMIMSGIVGAYFAGMDTVASTLSFMLYSALKVPGLLERLHAEIDGVWESEGGLTPAALRKMDVLHATALETLRLYPIAPFTPRTSTKAFEFEGYTVPAGSEVYVANGIPHLLPEFFPDPEVFDVNRYSRPDQPKTPHAFAPFSLGAHTCLGAGAAEVQMMTLIATLLRTAQLGLGQPNEVTIFANPLPNPGREFAFRFDGMRKPL